MLEIDILNLLRKEPSTMSNIQFHVGVSMPTLRRTFQELLDAGWIKPVGRVPSTGGRPAMLFNVNGPSHLAIGVHIELPSLHFVVAGLDGGVVESVEWPGITNVSPDETLERITEYTHAAIDRYHDRHFLGVGLALPGYIDSRTGEILSIGRAPGWNNFPIQARLETALGLPTVAENDIDCMTRVELENGYRDDLNLVYLGFIEGVKASLVSDGEFYKGPFGNAGLIGHTVVDPGGLKCSCGKRGCLETVASVHAVCARFSEAIRVLPNVSPSLARIDEISDHSDKFQAIMSAAEEGEPVCRPIVSDMLSALALAVSNLLHIFQTGRLIVGGALSNLQGGLRVQLEESIREQLPSLLRHHLVISYGTATGPHIAALGAAHELIQRFLRDFSIAAEVSSARRFKVKAGTQ